MTTNIIHRFAGALLLAAGLAACSSISQRGTDGARNERVSVLESRRVALAQTLAQAERSSALQTAEEITSYNDAVEKAVTLWLSLTDGPARGQSLACEAAGQSFTLQPTWNKALLFDELVPARTIKSKVAKRRITREGVGAPLIAWWKATPERRAQEPFMSEAGYVAAVTAVLNFRTDGNGRRTALLTLEDPRTSSNAQVAGRTHPLAADRTAIIEFISGQDNVGMSGMGALMRSDKNLDKLGLFSTERPAADRVPVILVHGLMSRPATWMNVVNELGTEPDLAGRYQFFFFRYPSGVPVLYSAAKLREQLGVLSKDLESKGKSYDAHHMVLIGHSMGGLVSKAQVQGSGDRLWVALFGTTPDKLNLTDEDRANLRRYLEFEPNPYVSRVAFVATPHRGSPLAARGSLIGNLARRLVKLPGKALGRTFDILQGHSRDNPVLRELLAKGVPTSVENLSDKSKFVKTSISLPLRPGLHIHSIIGNKKQKQLNDPKCSDGIVPYSSSHLDGVESELVVPAGHSAHESPEALAELKRILRLHLKEL